MRMPRRLHAHRRTMPRFTLCLLVKLDVNSFQNAFYGITFTKTLRVNTFANQLARHTKLCIRYLIKCMFLLQLDGVCLFQVLLLFPDRNECQYGNVCPSNSVCENTAGSFRCKCDPGFELVGSQQCRGSRELACDTINAQCFKLVKRIISFQFSSLTWCFKHTFEWGCVL